MSLSEAAAIALAGGDVTDLETARSVEEITQAHVDAAERTAAEAERKATQSEHAALTGSLTPQQAAADRETARYASLRAAVTRRRAERHAQGRGRVTSWENASASELAAAAKAIDQEYRRREAMDQAAREEVFKQELAEVKAGTRQADPEHVRFLTPQETVEAINRGQLAHQGVGADRRLSRRR